MEWSTIDDWQVVSRCCEIAARRRTGCFRLNCATNVFVTFDAAQRWRRFRRYLLLYTVAVPQAPLALHLVAWHYNMRTIEIVAQHTFFAVRRVYPGSSRKTFADCSSCYRTSHARDSSTPPEECLWLSWECSLLAAMAHELYSILDYEAKKRFKDLERVRVRLAPKLQQGSE